MRRRCDPHRVARAELDAESPIAKLPRQARPRRAPPRLSRWRTPARMIKVLTEAGAPVLDEAASAPVPTTRCAAFVHPKYLGGVLAELVSGPLARKHPGRPQ